MKVLVTGATGFVGGHLVARLLEDGHSVRALVRRGANAAVLESRGVEIVRGDILDSGSLEEAVEGAEAVAHLVGIIRQRGKMTFERVHQEGTANVISAMHRAGIPRLLHMSGLGARGEAPARYHRTKWAAEEMVRGSGLEYTIFRPSVIFGPGDGFTAKLISLVCGPPVIPLVAGGRLLIAPIAIQDVTACFAAALKDNRHAGQTYDLCGPDALSLADMIRVVAQTMKVHKPMLSLPVAAVRPAAFLGERLLRNPPITTDQLIMLLEGGTTDNNAAEEVFGLDLKRFIEEAPKFVPESCRFQR